MIDNGNDRSPDLVYGQEPHSPDELEEQRARMQALPFGPYSGVIAAASPASTGPALIDTVEAEDAAWSIHRLVTLQPPEWGDKARELYARLGVALGVTGTSQWIKSEVLGRGATGANQLVETPTPKRSAEVEALVASIVAVNHRLNILADRLDAQGASLRESVNEAYRHLAVRMTAHEKETESVSRVCKALADLHP